MCEYWLAYKTLGIGLLMVLIGLSIYASVFIRRLKTSVKAAQEASAAKSQLLANTSHELRTPLNSIIAMTELLAKTPLNPKQQDFISTLQVSAQTLLALINDILDFSKIEAGKFSLESTDFDFHALVNSTTRMFVPQAKAKGLAFNVHLSPGTPLQLRGDPSRVQQILNNLIGNAIKFTHEGSVEIRILPRAIESSRVRLLFMVIDTGIGVALEAQSRIFEKFAQADLSTTRVYGGTGLGTAIAKELVELMGGQIGFSSEPNRGSTFWFELQFEQALGNCADMQRQSRVPPATSVIETAATNVTGLIVPASLQSKDVNSLNILVGEDNPINQKVITKILESGQHKVHIVANGEQALDALEKRDYDLIILDMYMPVMSGIEAAKLFRFMHPERNQMPIVILTANATAEAAKECEDLGVDAYLTKPIEPQQLLDLIASLAKTPGNSVLPPSAASTREVPHL